jgi:hypothetical protein
VEEDVKWMGKIREWLGGPNIATAGKDSLEPKILHRE